jgi:predicted DNA-binding protein (MmcQ/YjbR family)
VTRDEILELCASFPGAVEDYRFGDGVAVIKVGGRMFALVPLDDGTARANLKCDPDLGARAADDVCRGSSRLPPEQRHWNTVELDGSIDDDELRDMVDHSYELVQNGLPRAQRTRLAGESST